MFVSARLTRRAGLGALVGGLAIAARAFAQQQPPATQPPPPPPPGQMRERHPMLGEAERALRHAREALEHAEHDFGGHRTKAIQYIDGALAEVRVARQMPG